MGLLDFLQGDDAQLGLGLLAAGGPSTVRMSDGQRIAGAFKSVNDQKQEQAAAKMKLLFQQSQIDENTSQNSIRTNTLAQQAKRDAYFMGGDAPSAVQSLGAGGPALQSIGDASGAAGAPSFGGIGGAAGGTPPAGDKFAQMERQYKIPRDALVIDYMNNGGKGIADMIYKRGTPDMKVSNGYSYDANKQGAGFLPQLSTSADGTTSQIDIVNGQPVVRSPQGALETFNAYQDARNRSGAAVKPIKVYNPQTQQEEFRNEGEVAGGQQPSALPQEQPGMTSSFQGPKADVLRMLNGIRDPQERVNALGAYSRQAQPGQQAPVSASGFSTTEMPSSGSAFAAGPSAPQAAQNDAYKASLVGTANANVVRDTAQIAAEKMRGQLTAGTSRALELLQQGPTASGIGSMADNTANFFGKSTAGADTASKLDTISGWLTSNVPRMEGPQSDADVINYKIMSGMVGDRTRPVSQRIGAVQELQRLQEKYAEYNGGKSTASGAAAQGSTAVPAPKTIKDFGYTSSAEAIKAAQNAILRGKDPAAVWRRVEEMGLSRPAATQGGL